MSDPRGFKYISDDELVVPFSRSGLSERDAEIRREARKRCLEEFEAFSKGEAIEAGIGSDVEATFVLAMHWYMKRMGEKK